LLVGDEEINNVLGIQVNVSINVHHGYAGQTLFSHRISILFTDFNNLKQKCFNFSYVFTCFSFLFFLYELEGAIAPAPSP